MRWKGRRASTQVEDRRGGSRRAPRGRKAGGIGLGGIILVFIFAYLTDQNPLQRRSEVEANKLSVLLELQADCFAGVWAHYAHEERQLLEPGDIEEGLRVAAAIGDDALQKRSTGRVRPESWTHGSSEQRQRWLYRGIETGDVNACDTFGQGS